MNLLKTIIILSIIIIISGCKENNSETDLLHKANPDGWYGKVISITEKHRLDNLLDDPEPFLGMDVLVTGEITEVCPMRGCWIDIIDPKTNTNIRVKVTDGEIVFPLSAKGKYVDVQGKFTKLEFTEEQAKQWKIHLAEEKSIHLNPEEIVITSDDLVEYRINGEGANIYTYGCK
tara:strand:+ start:257 stop:781 length:525 start_codon:yes stop_codon:yes gene_type:complete